MDQVYVIGGVLALLSVVQSVFGMGLLVFGTPTLLLLGLDFVSALGWLLPASLTISVLQVFTARKLEAPAGTTATRARQLINVGLVAVALLTALSAVVLGGLKASIDVWIGLAMLSAAVLRQSAWLNRQFGKVVRRHERIYLTVMGALHGATNMGGALLALYASSVTPDKEHTRLLVARYYLLFGCVQISVLLLLKNAAFPAAGLLFAVMAALIFLTVGNRAFKRVGDARYGMAFNGFIAAYGLAVLSKSYL